MDEFSIPSEPHELWAPDAELAFRCEGFVDLSEAAPEDVGDIAESEQLPPAFQLQWRDSRRGLHSGGAL